MRKPCLAHHMPADSLGVSTPLFLCFLSDFFSWRGRQRSMIAVPLLWLCHPAGAATGSYVSTAGLPISYPHTKNNLPANQNGCDNSGTTIIKLLARRVQICLVYFCVIQCLPLIFKNIWKQGPSKNIPGRFWFASSNTRLPTFQTLLRCPDQWKIDCLVS